MDLCLQRQDFAAADLTTGRYVKCFENLDQALCRPVIFLPAGDEALGCYLLKQLPQFSNSDIVRSRDPEVLKDCKVVLDVGSVYEPGKESITQLISSETPQAICPGCSPSLVRRTCK